MSDLPDSADAPRFACLLEPGAQPFVASADAPLLHALERAGLAWPSSCRNGTCRACIGELLSGAVRYAIPWPGLSAEEKAAGCVLPCVAHPDAPLVLRNGIRV
jgi:ferredoxin